MVPFCFKHPYIVEGMRNLSPGFPLYGYWFHTRGHGPSWPNHFLKTLPLNTITMEVRISAYEFCGGWGERHKHSVQNTLWGKEIHSPEKNKTNCVDNQITWVRVNQCCQGHIALCLIKQAKKSVERGWLILLSSNYEETPLQCMTFGERSHGSKIVSHSVTIQSTYFTPTTFLCP